MEKPSTRRFQGLEGIRAYAFILVFLVHYVGSPTNVSQQHKPRLLLYLWVFIIQLSWVAVPTFFVLSGFLITGVLYDTRNRRGFFKVFYRRRALRILPLYYLVVGLTALLALLSHTQLHLRDISYVFYLHNFFLVHGSDYNYGRYLSLTHLWSLAVEEQFYFLWPIVIWFVRRRSWLLWFSYAVIVMVAVLRICWPLTKLPLEFAYSLTFTRCDALMVGAALALHKREESFDLVGLVRPAKLALALGMLLFAGRVLWSGNVELWTYAGASVLSPVVNVMSAALIILAISPGNTLYTLCSRPWAVNLGSKSYGMYMIHFIPLPFFVNYFPQMFRSTFGTAGAKLISTCVAFALTYILASITFRFLEVPAMRRKDRYLYGEVTEEGVEPVRAMLSRIPSYRTDLNSAVE